MKNLIINYESKIVNLYLENNLLNKLNTFLKTNKKYFVLCDEIVYDLYSKKLEFENFIFKVIPAGEEHKNINTVEEIIKAMLDANISRSDVLINFGGGVISDLGGFVASIYKRGIEYINIPTTLLAMVDAALGGKTAIDLSVADRIFKNQVGSFYHPSLILVDPSLLKTLPNSEYLSGLGEVIKYGFCFDKDLFYTLFNAFKLEDAIFNCLEIKSKITSVDEYDQNIRLALNYGHTIGHAVEAITNFKIPHGICVLYGMLIETIDEKQKVELLKIIEKFNISFDFDVSLMDLKNYIIQDKKIMNNVLKLPILEDIGQVVIKEITIEDFFKRFV